MTTTPDAPAQDTPASTGGGGWLTRLRQGLSRTSGKLGEGITGIFTRRTLDDAALDELEELLISADMGVSTAARVREALAKERFGKQVSADEVREALAEHITRTLTPYARMVDIDPAHRPTVVLVCGVNGNGKTTTLGKMAHLLTGAGFSTMLAAADTFRAAAVEQLQVWGQRTGCPVITGEEGADPASVAFRALETARAQGTDVLLIDTAGRLHTKSNLMEQLHKIVRVLKKLDPAAPHAAILVLDATTGQNAHAQVRAFGEIVGLTGLIVTKLDGTAKGGVVVSLAETFQLPIHAIGVGEGLEDLRTFDARDFARSLVGLEGGKVEG